MLQRYFEAGILIEADIETKLKTLDLNSEDLIEFVKDKNEFMITSELLGEFMSHPPKHNIEEKKEIKEEKKVEVLKTHYKPVAKDYSLKLNFLRIRMLVANLLAKVKLMILFHFLEIDLNVLHKYYIHIQQTM